MKFLLDTHISFPIVCQNGVGDQAKNTSGHGY